MQYLNNLTFLITSSFEVYLQNVLTFTEAVLNSSMYRLEAGTF